jgi:hypothetical protein
VATARAETEATVLDRLRLTVALLEERGYAVTLERGAELCWGGTVSPAGARAAVAGAQDLELAEGLLVSSAFAPRAGSCRRRAAGHAAASAAYRPAAERFARRLAAVAPFVVCVAIAGSLASGGFAETDDVDLNLVVEDGYRHLAYVVLNLLGVIDALGRRGKPVDAASRRPLAPRVMTANLILERSQCFPLARTDAQMALELLQSRPVHGAGFLARVVAANPALSGHFPQLRERPAPVDPSLRRVPEWLFPRVLDAPARLLGEAAWRWMMWTRRRSPEALRRVAYVRRTMQPYALFAGRDR